MKVGRFLKVVITGGAGFIGSHFVRELYKDLGSVSEVVVIDSLTYAGRLKNVEDFLGAPTFRFYNGDICDPHLPIDLFSNAYCVVNFAAESHVDRSIFSSGDFIRTNIEGTRNLLELTLRAEVPKFLQVSTDEVYGSITNGSWDEGSPLLPNSPYSASKASADLLVRAYNKTFGLHTNVTRCSNNFGTHQYPEKVIPVIIRSILSNNQIPIYGNGSNQRDWLHVEDHCRALKLVMSGGKSGEIYNIGGGTELANIDLARRIVELMGANENLIAFVSDRKGHDLRYSVNYTKLNTELGYVPKHSIDNSLVDVIDWYTTNYSWWD